METLEDEYCPDCGKYGNHTCKPNTIHPTFNKTFGDVLGQVDDLVLEAQRLTSERD